VIGSRLLGAAAACVILLFCVAGFRKSYWSGCIKGAKVIYQQIFAILALVIFIVKSFYFFFQNCVFFALASRSGFGAVIPVVKISLCIFFSGFFFPVCERFCV